MPKLTNQSRKHSIGLAGEFLVAGELLRRGVMAAVTYGNAKKADVIAIYGDKASAIEVKSTSETKWVLGGVLPLENDSIWILVQLPKNEVESPQYYVLTSTELRALVLPSHEKYNQRYFEKHGKTYDQKGVVSIKRELLDESHLGAWHKVLFDLGIQK